MDASAKTKNLHPKRMQVTSLHKPPNLITCQHTLSHNGGIRQSLLRGEIPVQPAAPERCSPSSRHRPRTSRRLASTSRKGNVSPSAHLHLDNGYCITRAKAFQSLGAKIHRDSAASAATSPPAARRPYPPPRPRFVRIFALFTVNLLNFL